MLRELVYILIKDPLSQHSGPTLGMHEELCGDSGIVLVTPGDSFFIVLCASRQ